MTREFAAAAQKAAPAGTVIRMKLQASPTTQTKGPAMPDWLEITLFSAATDAERNAQIAQLLQALNAVAARHKLAPGTRGEQRNGTSLSFRSGTRITHSIEIGFARRAAPAQREVADSPRLAIILDDLGSDRAAAESIFALPYPVTISVLPNHEHSKEIADEALQRGFQVMLHLPMQSIANEAPEKEELRPGMSAAQVQSLLGEMIESVPNAVGVNNHQGSQATSDPALMKELMPALRGLNLFYVDSRTTAATVAFDIAQQDGVPAAFRNVPFLDDVQDAAAIRKQLQLALRGAKEKKAAIAIGHPHPATLGALREFLPTVRENGVRLVFASDLVH
ncbi:MAG TPA: divergent polysaccharide deacetylase family protein [Candidatus Acidoferrum sp.]|nr:divergent polysaccharide deacetylase family protein [Candidatus Acidoferrum sp.]